MKFTTKISIIALAGSLFVGCATNDLNSEEAAVKRLVASEGLLEQNVDSDFEGKAYDQDGEKVVCKKIKVTGSRIGQYTVCKTEEEWATLENDAKSEVGRMQDAGARFAEETNGTF